MQGKEKALAKMEEIFGTRNSFEEHKFNGNLEQAGSWYSFKTGRKILGYPCSYCKFLHRCFPNTQLEIKGDKPIWVTQ